MVAELVLKEKYSFKVRVVVVDGSTWFVARDVAACLGYVNTNIAIRDHCKKARDFRANSDLPTATPMKIIPESDVYLLAIRSKLKSAEKFQTWVCEEVLPSLRSDGSYCRPDAASFSVPKTFSEALRLAADQAELIERQQIVISEQTKKIEQDRPRVEFARTVEGSKGSILVRELAKLARQRGVAVGEKRLYQWFRENGYILYSKNLPTQRSMEQGLFEVRESTRTGKDPQTDVYVEKPCFTSLVTPKGQIYFIDKLLKEFASGLLFSSQPSFSNACSH